MAGILVSVAESVNMNIKQRIDKAVRGSMRKLLTRESDSLEEIANELTGIIETIVITEIGKIKE